MLTVTIGKDVDVAQLRYGSIFYRFRELWEHWMAGWRESRHKPMPYTTDTIVLEMQHSFTTIIY